MVTGVSASIAIPSEFEPALRLGKVSPAESAHEFVAP
jgi:hypothetical protein